MTAWKRHLQTATNEELLTEYKELKRRLVKLEPYYLTPLYRVYRNMLRQIRTEIDTRHETHVSQLKFKELVST